MTRKIALALGSGGARGWSHIGVIRALEEAGIATEIVCGTSMGALVGGAYVSGVLDELEAFARSLTQVSMMRFLDLNITSGGAIEGKLIERELRALGYKETFAEADKLFCAVATDLFDAREIWLREGDLVRAIRASIAIPGVFSPVFLDNRWLMDGGMTNPVPVSACRALDADLVIAVNPDRQLHASRRRRPGPRQADLQGRIAALVEAAPSGMRGYLQSVLSPKKSNMPRSPDYFTVITAAIDAMTDQIRRSRMAGEPPHVLVETDLHQHTILDFHCADEAIAAGRKAMEGALPRVAEFLDPEPGG